MPIEGRPPPPAEQHVSDQGLDQGLPKKRCHTYRWEQSIYSTPPHLLDGHVGPVEGPPAEQHVSDQGLDRGLAHEPHEEELLDHLGRHGAQ
ncbi:hypothetical protein ACOMHN_001120 [Nucella lapillus]